MEEIFTLNNVYLENWNDYDYLVRRRGDVQFSPITIT